MRDEALERLMDYAEKQRAEASACRNCGFFAVRGDDKTGECWRYPPAEPVIAGEEYESLKAALRKRREGGVQ